MQFLHILELASSNGKGPVDGIGGIIKRFISQKIIQRKFSVQDPQSFEQASEGCQITFSRCIYTSKKLLHYIHSSSVDVAVR